MTSAALEKIYQLVDNLTREEQERLVEHLIHSSQSTPQADSEEDLEFTDEEIAEMLTPKPLTGREIVEAGLTGAWADMGIEDSVEWLKEQRAKRSRKLKW